MAKSKLLYYLTIASIGLMLIIIGYLLAENAGASLGALLGGNLLRR